MAEIYLVDPNTRQGKRTPVTLKIKFKSETLEQFIERYAIDVSQGGIFIRTKEPLAVGTQMKFEFQLRDASPLIAGEGTVVWTRENDPSRPAIAPGMGVRFDRLADGSQGILERILAEKAKQAPQRPAPDTTKPPLFSDTPTRVAPAPVQEALLGKDNGRRRDDAPNSDSHTPLPRPMPFHSDADEFPDEAFEEATKVRALDELIAQTADGAQGESARRSNGRADSESASDRAETVPAERDILLDKERVNAAMRRSEPLAAVADAPEAPDLPNPPELTGRPAPRLLDTSPSPRFESSQPVAPSEQAGKTRLGVEPARARVSPPIGAAPMEAPPLPPDGLRAVATEQTQPARMPAARSRSGVSIAILVLVLLAAGAAAVWFLVLRPRQIEQRDIATGSSAPVTGSDATPGSNVASTGSADPASANPTTGSAGSAAPAAELVDTVIEASVAGATVELTGTPQSGPAPFTAKLEKGKPYKARVTARGFLPAELEIKGGDDKPTAKLTPKPRVVSVASEPSGAVILIDGSTTGHTTPFDVELSAAQAAKKSIRVQLRKAGYRTFTGTIDLGRLVEEDARMLLKLNERLATAPAPAPSPPGGATRGSAQDTGEPPGGGSSSEPPAPSGGSAQGSAAPAAPATPPPASEPAGSAAEPEPDFTKKP
jgi:uncharacterized protein (TIGR02266 family)